MVGGSFLLLEFRLLVVNSGIDMPTIWILVATGFKDAMIVASDS